MKKMNNSSNFTVNTLIFTDALSVNKRCNPYLMGYVMAIMDVNCKNLMFFLSETMSSFSSKHITI